MHAHTATGDRCTHTGPESSESTNRGQFLIIPKFVYLAVVRFFTYKPPQTPLQKFLFLDSGENIQTVLIPLAGKRDGLFPEQSITSEYKNKYGERARSKPQSEEGKNLLGSVTAAVCFSCLSPYATYFLCIASLTNIFSSSSSF